jgi:hypothetical protein
VAGANDLAIAPGNALGETHLRVPLLPLTAGHPLPLPFLPKDPAVFPKDSDVQLRTPTNSRRRRLGVAAGWGCPCSAARSWRARRRRSGSRRSCGFRQLWHHPFRKLWNSSRDRGRNALRLIPPGSTPPDQEGWLSYAHFREGQARRCGLPRRPLPRSPRRCPSHKWLLNKSICGAAASCGRPQQQRTAVCPELIRISGRVHSQGLATEST